MNSEEALAKLSKYLLYLENVKPDVITRPNAFTDNKEELLSISKDLCILKILKKKKVNIKYLAQVLWKQNGDILKQYNAFVIFDDYKLTEEEFNLLKEWLKND